MFNRTGEKAKPRKGRKGGTLLPSLFMKKTRPIIENYNKLMAYYKCAIMEMETKLNVLNEEYSLQYDRNPITGIQTRLKKLESIVEKLERDDFPLTLESMEENLNDVAGVRVICSFVEDVYMVADTLLRHFAASGHGADYYDAVLTGDVPLGVSNRRLDGLPATVSVRRGTLLIFQSA